MTGGPRPTYHAEDPTNEVGFETAARRILNDLLTIHMNNAELELRTEIQDRLTDASGGIEPTEEEIAADPDWQQFPDRLRQTLEARNSILSLFAVPCSQCTSQFNSCTKPPAQCCTDYRACLSDCILTF